MIHHDESRGTIMIHHAESSSFITLNQHGSS